MSVVEAHDGAPVNLDTRLLADLAYLRLHPFGGSKLAERLAKTTTLSELAASLYGPATTLSARDQHQRSLIITASRRMDGTNGEALRRLLGLTPDTSGKDRAYRHDVAGQTLWPKARTGSSFARREYWEPFLQLAVAALQDAVRPDRLRDADRPIRDVEIPIVDRDDMDMLAHTYTLFDDHPNRLPAVVVYGSPGSGALTCTEQALARMTLQNRHIIRVDNRSAYHRDLLSVLDTYGIQAETWSLAACEIAFRDLLEDPPDAMGGIILRRARTADDVVHLLPTHHRVPIFVTARFPSSSSARWYFEHYAELPTPEEARKLLESGHPTAALDDLELLGRLLYSHPGILTAAARSTLTVATLIRRARRDRISTALEFAQQSGNELIDDAQQIVLKLSKDADALLALDVALWLTACRPWRLYHVLGFLLPGRASPARINRALAQLDSAGLADPAWGSWSAGSNGPLVPVLRHQRAHRMTPLLHTLARLNIPEHLQSAVTIIHHPGTPRKLPVDGSDVPVTVMECVLEDYYAALFCGNDGIPHAQLYVETLYTEHDHTLEVYEDGRLLPHDHVLDPDSDSNWPAVTRYMLSVLRDADFPQTNEHTTPGSIAVHLYEGPIHKPDFGMAIGDPVPLEDWEFEPYVPDESVDGEAGEIFG